MWFEENTAYNPDFEACYATQIHLNYQFTCGFFLPFLTAQACFGLDFSCIKRIIYPGKQKTSLHTPR